jgi:hypothetical protein
MPLDPIPKDPESLEKWRQLPQEPPSRQALPPAAGGSQRWVGLLIVMAILIILALLAQARPG